MIEQEKLIHNEIINLLEIINKVIAEETGKTVEFTMLKNTTGPHNLSYLIMVNNKYKFLNASIDWSNPGSTPKMNYYCLEAVYDTLCKILVIQKDMGGEYYSIKRLIEELKN